MTICSLVVQVRPEHMEKVNQSFLSIDGLEVHAQTPDGKMIVVLDHPEREYCSQVMTDISQMPHIMSTSLVYEYQEDEDIDN